MEDLCCHLKCTGTRMWNLNCKSKSSQPAQPKYGSSCLVNFETCKIKEIVNLKEISIVYSTYIFADLYGIPHLSKLRQKALSGC